MKSTLGKRIPQILFIIAILLFIAVAILNVRSINSLSEALKWDKHTQQVLLQLDETLITKINAETSIRGFVILGDEAILAPYNEARQNIKSRLAKLRELTEDNQDQSERTAQLETMIDERFVFFNQLVEARRTKSIEQVRPLFGDRHGKELSDKIRSSITQIKDEETKLYTDRERELSESLNYTRTITYLAGFVGIFFLGIAAFANFRESKKLVKVQDELRIANKDLEKRVEERTEELQQKNDELKDQIHQREQAEQYRRIALEAGNLGTWIFDPLNDKAEIDERGLSLFGFTENDFDGSGKNVFSRIYKEDFPTVQELFQKSLTEKSNFNAEFRVLMPDGAIRWNNCTGQAQVDKNGTITRLIGNCRDITDGKESEFALRRSEKQVRNVIDNLFAFVGVLSPEGILLEANRTALNAASLSSEDVIGKHFTETYWWEYSEEVKNQMQNSIEKTAAGESVRYDVTIRIGENKFIPIDFMLAPLFDEDGQITHLISSGLDLTPRKQAEEALKNSEQFNRSIFENSPDCVKILDLDGTLHSMNANGLCVMEIDDFTPYVGKQWIDFWEGDENEMAYQSVESAKKGQTANFQGFCRTAKGTLKWWDVSVAPVFDADGKPVRIISTLRDISERREAEREREDLLKNEKAARKDAEIANRLRDEFLATVSHELRAPLNSILGWGRLLERGTLDETTTEKALKTIVRNAESQNRLIEDLLDVSRIISGKLRLEVMTVKPINIVESALENVRPAAEAKGIILEIKQDAEISHISGDPNRLQQVIWNLLSNAIKFTPSDGRVTLEIERENEFVNLRVKDTGVGIKEEFLPHVFDRFRQADASSIRKFGGLGLGLAIVRHITEMHGGTVAVESEGEGKGSTFTVRLPLLIASEENDSSSNQEETLFGDRDPHLNLDGLLILVVDDEEDTRQLLIQALTYYGATVISAASAEEAISEIQDKNPDFLVSDIGMPDEDGYSLIRRIRNLENEQHKNISAVALTAFTRAQDRMRALGAGFQNHVPKPVEPDELITVIASLTGRVNIGDDA